VLYEAITPRQQMLTPVQALLKMIIAKQKSSLGRISLKNAGRNFMRNLEGEKHNYIRNTKYNDYLNLFENKH
jgi:hypothetical protein